MPTIDTLDIQIKSTSTQAADGIQKLAVSLGELKKNGSVAVAVRNLNNLSEALRRFTMSTSASNTISALATSMGALKGVGSVANVASGIEKLGVAVKSLDNVTLDPALGSKMQSLADAMGRVSGLKSGGLPSMVNALSKIGDVTKKLDDTTINNFADRVAKLNDKLEPLSTKMTTIQAGLRGVNSSARSAGDGVKHLGTKVNATTLNMASMITVVQGIVSALRPVVMMLSNAIGQAIEWDGIAARFGRGFGSQAEEVYSWIQRLNEEMGINTQQFMQYSSVFATMLTGFGVGVEDAANMALGYTELTYDIWAGYNDVYKNFADAAEAVKSAIAGEVEPIRRAGFTIVESTLEQTAANHGLEISLEKATEAQKSYLRYLTLVDQAHAQNLVGSYAREMNTAEGVMRTFAQSVKSMAQALGSLFLPILVRVMPWIQAFVELLTQAIHAVAAFFGIDIQPISWGSSVGGALDNVSDSAGGATDALGDTADAAGSAKKAVEDLKKATIGIDELNVISPPNPNSGSSGDSGGSGGGGIGGGLSEFENLGIGSLWDESIFDQIQSDVDKIKALIEEALASITAVISGFMLAIGTILVVTGANIPLGLALMAVGAVGLVATIATNWSTMSDQLAKTLTIVTSVLGGFLLAIGAFLAFSGVNVGLGIALMAAGAVSLATAATINWKFLDGELENSLSILTGIISGGLLAMGALFAFTGVSVGLGIALMVAGAVGLATAVGLNWDSMSDPMRKAIGTLEMIVGSALLSFGAVLAFSGANVPLGIALIAAGAVSMVAAERLNWDSLNGDVKNSLATITTLVSGAAIGLGAVLAFSGVATGVGIALIAAGVVGIVASAPVNWSYITDKIKDVLREIGIAAGASLLALGLLLVCTGVGIPIGMALIAAGAASLIAGTALNWDSIVDSVKQTVSDIGEAWDGLWESCKKGIKKMWDGVVGWFEDLWDTLVGHSIVPDTIDGIVDCFTGLPGKVLKTVEKFVTDIVTKFKEFKVVQVAVSLIKKGWTTVAGWIGKIPGVSQAVSLIKSGWSTVKGWIGSIPTLSQAIKLIKSGWSSVKGWIGSIPALSQGIKLVKSGWSTVKKWVGTIPTLSAGIKLVKSGWTTVKKWLGDLNFNLGFKLPKIGINWGKKTFAGFTISYPKGFYTYAKGGFPDFGEMFIAREAGPEMVGKIGNKTTVANNDQIVEGISEGVYSAVLAAMKASESNGGQDVHVYLDSREITASVERRQRERGANVMGKQVYAF